MVLLALVLGGGSVVLRYFLTVLRERLKERATELMLSLPTM